jgi:hypothetical protein
MPDIEDISSEESQREIRRLEKLEIPVSLARFLTSIGASVCSFWLIYRVFAAHGFLLALLAFVGLGFLFKFGLSPMFAVAASFLCFHFNAVGSWLPITSYALAASTLYLDLVFENLRRRVDPYNLRSNSLLG